MTRFRIAGPMAGPVIVIGALVTLAACGGGEPADTPVLPTLTVTAAPAVTPTAAAVPTATVAPTRAPTNALPQPTATPEPTPTPAPAQTPTPEPTATSTPEPTPTPVLLRTFDALGFTLNIGRGADVQTAGSPGAEQGALSFAYGQVNTVLTWTPQGDTSTLALVDATYGFIQSNQPDLTFKTLSDGEINADGEPGVVLGFKAVDASGSASGGLIGSWTCRISDTSFTLTLTGTDTTLVQVRFDELIDNFGCSSS